MWRDLIILTIVGFVPGTALAQSGKMSPTDSSPPLPLTTSKDHTDTREHLTAEDVLRALQRQRPRNTIIPPSSAEAVSDQDEPRLLPEGYSIVSRTGVLVPSESGGRFAWSFRFDQTDEAFPLKTTPVLPSATLEPMARSAASQPADAPPLHWEVTGELTVFEGRNYLLIHLAVAAPVSLPKAPDGSGPGDATKPAAAVETDEADAVRADASVEDVLNRMQDLDTMAPPVGIARTSPANQPDVSTGAVDSGDETASPRGWLAEGAAIVNRPCRLAKIGDWHVVAFESDHPERPEPPMKVLPNLGLELLLEETDRRAEGAVFLISGQMTSFENENYLLLRNVRRRIVSGNFSK